MATCPYCGESMNKFDYELTGGHRKCLEGREGGMEAKITCNNISLLKKERVEKTKREKG